ncbi:hypothetical protein HAX54_002842 [Datura stramonium]|uniref:Uncharacterized protein n=1 Tax=Datura stramonium TaxID=4076 RepID=A0ABS8WW80_DATST|nr:hypothetical protein [Datura stramonium]
MRGGKKESEDAGTASFLVQRWLFGGRERRWSPWCAFTGLSSHTVRNEREVRVGFGGALSGDMLFTRVANLCGVSCRRKRRRGGQLSVGIGRRWRWRGWSFHPPKYC